MRVDYDIVMGVLGGVLALVALLWVLLPEFSKGARRLRRRIVAFGFMWRAYLLALPFLFVFLVSVFLLQEQAPNLNEAVYEALRMFTLNANFEFVEYDDNQPVQILWVLRLVAPVLTATGLLGFVYGKIRNRPMLFMRGHFVVVGLGPLGRAICEELLEKTGRAVLAIEKDEENPNVQYLRGKGVRVLVGDATSPEVLVNARVRYAAKFIAVTDDDFVNLQSVILAVGNPEKSDSRANKKQDRARQVASYFSENAKPWAMVHIANSDIRDSLSPESLDSTSATHLELPKVLEDKLTDFIRLFSSYQAVSEQLLTREKVDDWPDDESRLVVIAGFGRLGHQILEQVLKRKTQTPVWIVDAGLEGKAPIDLVTDMRFDDVRMVEGDSPVLSYGKAAEKLNRRVRLFACDVMNRSFGADLLEKSGDDGVEAITLFLGTENDLKNVSVSGRLKQYLSEGGDVKVSIVSRRFGLEVESEKEGGPVESGVDEFWFMDEFFRSFFKRGE